MKPIQTVPEPLQTQDAPIVIQMVYPEVVEDDTVARRLGLRPRSKVANADQDYVHSYKEQGHGMTLSDDDDPDYIDSDYDLSEDDDDLDADNPNEGEYKKDKKIRERIREKWRPNRKPKRRKTYGITLMMETQKNTTCGHRILMMRRGMICSGH
jgi:hypothetical protein